MVDKLSFILYEKVLSKFSFQLLLHGSVLNFSVLTIFCGEQNILLHLAF